LISLLSYLLILCTYLHTTQSVLYFAYSQWYRRNKHMV